MPETGYRKAAARRGDIYKSYVIGSTGNQLATTTAAAFGKLLRSSCPVPPG
jgi:hypothetical protein